MKIKIAIKTVSENRNNLSDVRIVSNLVSSMGLVLVDDMNEAKAVYVLLFCIQYFLYVITSTIHTFVPWCH